MLDGDYTAYERCEYCKGTLVGIDKVNDGYLVQCETCGMVTKVRYAQKNNQKPSRMARVRKIKQKYYDKE